MFGLEGIDRSQFDSTTLDEKNMIEEKKSSDSESIALAKSDNSTMD